MFDTGDRAALIGMVHLHALPGSPGWAGSINRIVDAAVADAEALKAGGADALLVENMHDLPYLNGHVHPETVAAAAVAARAVAAAGLPMGIQILAGAWRESLGVAIASGASFVRVEAFSYGHVADEGWMDACAGPLLRQRAALGAKIRVVADIQKKHASHAATADLDLPAWVHGAAFCGADAVVVTGASTGSEAKPDDLAAASGCGLPVWVGSGVTPDNAAAMAAHADALIVGTSLKVDGDWRRPVDPGRVRRVRDALD